MNTEELLGKLRDHGEDTQIEAKTASELGKSTLETVCAYANEPGLEGGHILLGIQKAETESGEGFAYTVVGVPNPEKVIDDLASQCSTVFNHRLRPNVKTVQIEGRAVVHIYVSEASPNEKPVFFKNRGLPDGAFRRIGSSDQRCTEDDLQILYDERRRTPFDADAIIDATWDDLSSEAIEEYRRLRQEISPEAEELSYKNEELLEALKCVQRLDGVYRPTVAGILLFGKPLALRRLFPMMRVDYIRVPGREWMENPYERYTAVEIRGPLMQTIRRAEAAILDDLPKGFRLPEGSLQRTDVSAIPRRVLREAIVNSVMHRSYRVHGAVQIIRYANRIELLNPGYSLKSPERLGEPRSETRNPNIAAVLHETNFAETKGTGIRVMRRLMKDSDLLPPTFESNRRDNQFNARLLLHHFLTKDDLAWIDSLGNYNLTPDEKVALIFVREVGAIDNAAYRDLNDVETLQASSRLRHLRNLNLLVKRGQSTATYYVATEKVQMPLGSKTIEQGVFDFPAVQRPSMVDEKPSMVDEKPSMVDEKPSMVDEKPSMVDEKPSMPMSESESIHGMTVPPGLKVLLDGTSKHEDAETIRRIIRRLCSWKALSAGDIAKLLKRNPTYLKTRFLTPMVNEGLLQHSIPEMPKHPNQAYSTPD